jgi:UDP-N-acetylmuramoyl-L-alanyl-D-glutamate--2,6-diaminopimelate ligase
VALPVSRGPRYEILMRVFSLADLAKEVGGHLVTSSPVSVSDITCSSADVQAGSLFVAVRGATVDGHRFIPDATARGAQAVVAEDLEALGSLPGIVVKNTRLALSKLAAVMNGNPARTLRTIGITGTNGKTTTNWIVYHILNEIGGGCQRIGTLGTECMGKRTEVGSLTSPDAISMHRLLRQAVEMGAQHCVLEASSHALDQARVEDLEFDVGIFMNLTRDHLDYHKTFENYFAAKRRLFELVQRSSKSTKGAVIHGDDEHGRRLIAELPTLGLVDWSFGTSEDVALRICSLEETMHQMHVTLGDRAASEEVRLSVPFIGRHNAENVVAAYGACRALGYEPSAITDALTRVAQVPGRLERVGQGEPRVFVDYAHTPDALRRVLQAVRPTTVGDLWVVFGCGGDRDKGKRPEMAAVASEFAEQVVITSDNPRTEDPRAIINDIMVGAVSPRIVEVDRKSAIHEAISLARSGDTVVIAGKGHEDYQILGNDKIFFSDQEVAKAVLARHDLAS